MSTGSAPLRVTIAEEVRAHMARRRLSAVRLGMAIGRSQSYMSRRLTGETPFDLDDLEAICAVLDVPLSALIAGPVNGGQSFAGNGTRYAPKTVTPSFALAA